MHYEKQIHIVVLLSERYKTGLLNFCLSKSVLCKPSIFPYYTTIEVSLSESPPNIFFLQNWTFLFLQTVLEFREQQWVVFLRSIFFIVRYSKYQVYDFVNSRTQLITPDLGFAQNTNCFFLLKGSRWELRSVNASNIKTLWNVGGAQTVSLGHRVRGLMSDWWA